VEGKNGVWSYTTGKLAPEMYSYTFNIDGMTGVKDPANIYVNRDIVSFTNIFIVSAEKGDKGDLYRVNEVPHGNLSKVWYNSPTLLFSAMGCPKSLVRVSGRWHPIAS
jgi:enterochelin esterase family protein